MKNLILVFFLFPSVFSMVQGQTNYPLENVVITSEKYKTQVRTNENGELLINVSPKDVLKFKANRMVRYIDFGARGDGKTDDIDAIAAAHAFANQEGLPVKANEGATYYIGGKNRTAVIRTDTDFGTAAFIIDDSDVENRNENVFLVGSSLKPFRLEGISSLLRNQEKIDISLPGTCLITVTNSNVKRYIRFGPNQNSGSPQTDIFMLDKDGKVDMNTPIIWDFDQITVITALPIDETTLTITGGRLQPWHRNQAFQCSGDRVGTPHHRRRRPWSTLWRLHQYRRLRLHHSPEYHPDRTQNIPDYWFSRSFCLHGYL
jgi:hypothetical protein